MPSGLEDDYIDNVEYDISISVSILNDREKYYKETENGSILWDHVRRLKNGLQFLGKLYHLSIDENLANGVKRLAADVKHTLQSNRIKKNGVLCFLFQDLDHIYEDLRGRMISLVIKPNEDLRLLCIFQEDVHLKDNHKRIIEFLLVNISEVLGTWSNNNYATDDRHTVALGKMVGELKMALTHYMPLFRCLAHPPQLNNPLIGIPLKIFLNIAAGAVYFLLVGKMDEQIVVLLLQNTMKYGSMKFNIYARALTLRCSRLPSLENEQFYILDSLILILAMNLDSLNDANNHLYAELRELRAFVENQTGHKKLNHYLGLTASTEAICYQAVPIVYSCYVVDVELEEDMRLKLNDLLISVIGQISMIKKHHGFQEIKLYDYPRVDCLGFLDYFLGHLKELQEHEQILIIKSGIESLHEDIHFLVSSPKTSEDKLISEGLWTQIFQLAYQAEYVVDLYLVIPNSCCISTLSIIVEQVKEVKEKVLALMDKSRPVEDVVATSSHVCSRPVRVNNVFLGFEEEIGVIRRYLLGGENDLQAISLVGMAGAGKTSLAKHIFNESSVVRHFDKRLWCTVSQSFQIKELLLTILNEVNPSKSDIREMDEQKLADELHRSLRRLRYLLVIDDLWDADLWNYLSRYFPDDKTPSRIFITTRDHNVASKTKSRIHELREMTEEESWKLLQKNIASERKFTSKSWRNEIIWNEIAKDVTSTILNEPQEDHEISVTRLIRLWVAEGLVREEVTSEESVEDLGKRYVDDLINRCLVIPIKEKTNGGVKIFQLHDLLRDFCLKKAKDEHLFTVLDDRTIYDLSFCPRRISISRGRDKHLPFISLNNVRTMLTFCEGGLVDSEIERSMESENIILLNVLELHHIIHITSYFHNLLHLRYLAIWEIVSSNQVLMQSSIFKLWNLQTLILSFNNITVFEVPECIWDLVKLRHINILPSALFPRHDSKRLVDSPVLLKKLKSLSMPCLDYGDSNWLTRFPELQKLKCKLWKDGSQKYRFPDFGLCNGLISLKVVVGSAWCKREWCKLNMPASLRKLSVSIFILDSDDFSEIGKSLPNLEVLKLHKSFKNWSVNDGDFPKLKALKITGWDCREWDASEDSFPNLE